MWLCFFLFLFIIFNYVFDSPVFISVVVPPLTVLHHIPPPPWTQEMISPLPTSTPDPTRLPHSPGSQVSPGLGASSLTEARPGHPRLYMSALVSRGLYTPSFGFLHSCPCSLGVNALPGSFRTNMMFCFCQKLVQTKRILLEVNWSFSVPRSTVWTRKMPSQERITWFLSWFWDNQDTYFYKVIMV